MAETKRIEKRGNILVIDGEYWQFINKYDGSAMVFHKIDKDKFDKLANLLVKKLSPHVEKKMLLIDALGELPIENLEKIAKLLIKKKVRPRQRHGCIELAIGDEVVSLRG